MTRNLSTYSRYVVHPVTMLSVSHGDRENIATMAWVSPVSTTPPLLMVAVSPKRYSHNLVLKSSEFAIIVLTDQQKELSTLAGTISGAKQNKWEMQQFAELKTPAKEINTSVLRNCLAVYECKLVDHFSTGDHSLFIGEVIHSDPNDELQPLILYNRQYLKPGEFVAKYP